MWLSSWRCWFCSVVDVELFADSAVVALTDVGLEIAVECWPGVTQVFLGFAAVSELVHVYAVELVDFVPRGVVVVAPVFENVSGAGDKCFLEVPLGFGVPLSVVSIDRLSTPLQRCWHD